MQDQANRNDTKGAASVADENLNVGHYRQSSLTDLLIRLLADHVPKEVAYQYTKGSKFYGKGLESDPPIWERTAWDTTVRWLARESKFFHGIDPADSIDEDPIDTYERLLREYLTDVKGGGPTQGNPVAAELIDIDRQGIAAELYKVVGADLALTTEMTFEK